MPAQGIPGLYIDTSATADSLSNSRRLSTWGRTVSPRMFGVDLPQLGTLPEPATPQDGYLMQAGTPELSFTAGAATWTFPFPFPNGVLFIIGGLPSQSGALASEVTTGRPALDHVPVFLVVGGTPWASVAFIALQAIGW